MRTNVTVGVSGGVDSSVAALLLKQQGYIVRGNFMVNWEDEDDKDYCSHYEDLSFAKNICGKIGISLETVNFARNYWDNVFAYFLESYQNGYTPNPDILCNQEIKFKAFFEHAIKNGADFLATGHYARIIHKDGEHYLARGKDNNKDQSYFLYAINKLVLPKVLFPVGELEKPMVRSIAKEHGLITHGRQDSTGICFIGERKFKDFLNNYLPSKPGDTVTITGKKIARHNGLMYYTLGQRKGLGIGGVKGADERPWFVAAKDMANNQLIVTQEHNHPWCLSSKALVGNLNWLATPPKLGTVITAKARYRQEDFECCIEAFTNENIVVAFNHQQHDITPGQSLVLYDGEICLGGGVIQATDSAGGLLQTHGKLKEFANAATNGDITS